MEFEEIIKSGNYLFLRECKKFEFIRAENLKSGKLNLLTKMVANEENKTYSKLHSVYMKYFPEWNLLPNKMIPEIYRRLLKKYPNEFINPSCVLASSSLENKLELIKRNVIKYEQILLDYDCIKNISIIILNCLHSIIKSKNKKLCVNSFLQRENLNLLDRIFQEFFDEMETIKSINIQLFDVISIPIPCNIHKSDNFLLTRHQTLSTSNSDIYKSTCISDGNRIVGFQNETVGKEKQKLEIDFVYVFFLFMEIIFPNHLEIELNLSMSSLLDKKKKKDGEYKNLKNLNKKFEAHFLTILLTTYFISKDKKIQKLDIKTQDSLKIEIDNFLNYVVSNSNCENGRTDKFKEFTFLDNFYRTLSFNIFHSEINSLDSLLFERTNFIAMRNLGIRSFHTKLFPSDLSFFNDKLNLIKLHKTITNILLEKNLNVSRIRESEAYSRCKSKTTNVNNDSSIMIDKLLEKRPSVVYFSNLNLDEELYGSESNEILSQLYPYFEDNIKDLFFIIESKVNILRDIKIIINPPKIVYEQKNYLSLLTVFIYNVLKIIENNSNEIISLEIESDKVPLDYLLLGILKNREIHIDLRKSSIVNLVFNVKLEKCMNVLRFIPENVVCLNLAALTNETFIFLVNKLKKKFKKYKNLVDLSITINLTNSDIPKLIEYTFSFFMLDKPGSLENLRVNMKYILGVSDLRKLLDIIRNTDRSYKYEDKVKNLCLDLGISSNVKFDEFPRRLCCNRFDKKYENKLDKLLFGMKHSKLFHKLYRERDILKSICNFTYTYPKIVYLE